MLSMKIFLAAVEVSSTMLLAGTLGIVGLVLAGMACMKGYFNHQSQALQNGKASATEDSVLQRKYEEVSTRTYRPTFLWAGGTVALMLCFLVINWTSYAQENFVEASDLGTPEEGYYSEPFVIPPTPPSPKLTTFEPEKTEIDNPTDSDSDDADPDSDDADPNNEDTQNTVCENCPNPNEEEDLIISWSMEQPLFPSCTEMLEYSKAKKNCADSVMLAFIYSKINYPAVARTLGVEGTVVISFKVDENGRLSDTKILKKVGAGLEEEALRAVELMVALPTPWIPGRALGKLVKVKYNVPVKFRLK